MPIDPTLLDILACPECKESVTYTQGKNGKESLTCTKCKRVFPIIDNIPHMLPKDYPAR